MSDTTNSILKLDYLKDTKDLIANAIINKGQPVASTDTFRSYADKILNISGSGDSFITNIEPIKEDRWSPPTVSIQQMIASLPDITVENYTETEAVFFNFTNMKNLQSGPNIIFDGQKHISFGGCENLTNVPAYRNIDEIEFPNCFSLTTLPNTLLSEMANQTGFYYTFSNCISLAEPLIKNFEYDYDPNIRNKNA